jgi:plasmid stabilization system protein ParE
MIRISVTTICLLAAAGSMHAEDFRVLEDVDGAVPQEMKARYLLAEAQAALDRRDDQYEQLKTPEQLARWQRDIRAFFLEALGDFPERTPLNPRVVATDDRNGYRVENVIFESQPRHFVTANLYRPACITCSGAGAQPLHLCGATEMSRVLVQCVVCTDGNQPV